MGQTYIKNKITFTVHLKKMNKIHFLEITPFYSRTSIQTIVELDTS